MHRSLLVLGVIALAGCVYLPRTTEAYDEQCHVVSKHMTLEPYQLAQLTGCNNETCGPALAVIGAVAAASAVVSGTVVVVGNAVYWIEKQGRCRRTQRPTSPDTSD